MRVAPGVFSDLSLACPGTTHNPAALAQGWCLSHVLYGGGEGGRRRQQGTVWRCLIQSGVGAVEEGTVGQNLSSAAGKLVTLGKAISFLHLSLLIAQWQQDPCPR